MGSIPVGTTSLIFNNLRDVIHPFFYDLTPTLQLTLQWILGNIPLNNF